MTEQITGTVENGDRAVAVLPFYCGGVGVRIRAGSDLIEIAYRAEVSIGALSPRGRRAVEADRSMIVPVQLPARGTMNGEAIEVLSLERSKVDGKMMLATARLVRVSDL